MSLVTDANYKYYLGLNQSETITNNFTPLINAVEKRVKDFLHRDIETATYTDEIYDGSGNNSLVLRQFPITSIASVKVYEGIGAGNVETWTTLVEHTDYDRLIIPVEAHLFYLDGYRFVRQFQNYKVTYVAGYSSIPDDIQLACKKLVALYWNESPQKNNSIGLTNINNNAGGSVSTLNIQEDAETRILKSIEHHKANNV